jgi:tRNA-modifying protein YgfZ
MTAETFSQIEQQGGVIALNDHAKLMLTGADRVRFLNGQVTNDVRKATASSTVQACVTNLKGKVEALITVHSAGEALYLDSTPDLREALAQRLEKYIIADDVELHDVTDEWSLCHIFGAAAQSPEFQLFLQQPSENSHVLKSARMGQPGFDVWIRGGHLSLGEMGGHHLSVEEAEVWRICHGIAAWPNELAASVFPQEAGLEASVMDFAKGCYIGQEVLSRIKTTGKMPRILRKWSLAATFESVGAIAAGMALHAKNESWDLAEAGTVTSACLHPVLDRWVGLAYVRQNMEAVHSVLLAEEEPPRIFAELEFTL